MLTGIQTLDAFELENQRVFLRTHLDVPVSKAGKVEDDAPIERLIQTIGELEKRGARVIVASRFRDPKGEQPGLPNEKAPSIEPVLVRLAELGKLEVHLPDSATSEALRKVIEGLRPGRVCCLPNLAGEDDTGPQADAFAHALLPHIDLYVADSLRPLAYSSATTTILPRLVDRRAAGPGLWAELSAFARLRSSIDSPRLLIWGGNSLKARSDELLALLPNFHRVALVGVAANTMVAALGGALGATSFESDFLAGARTLADKLGDKLVLPVDFAVGSDPRAQSSDIASASHVPEGKMALDLGPKSRELLTREIERAGAVVWSGTVGFYRNPEFSVGTRTTIDALSASSAFTVVVGDDSVASVRATRGDSPISIDCISDGGKSALALLLDKKLPGLEALRGTLT